MKLIINSIKKYSTVWWIPILSYLLPAIIYFIATILKKDSIVDFALIIFYLNVLGNIISSIVQIVIRRWYLLFPQMIISFLLFMYVSILFTFSPPDYYGANKTIPKNININIPIEREINENDLKQNNFVLSSGFQPGMYNYHTNYKPTETGMFFIKAYEITSNDRLSEKRINYESKIIVNDLKKSHFSGKFTIYEGSWGDKYASRIELWFKSQNSKKEFKITEKNYVVEGWMR